MIGASVGGVFAATGVSVTSKGDSFISTVKLLLISFTPHGIYGKAISNFIAKNGKIKKSKLLKLDNWGKVGYGTCTNNTKVNEIFGLIPLVAAQK